MMYDFADELLAPYGKVMTWDIKAGLMGKREYPRDVSDRFFTWFTMINGAESATNVRCVPDSSCMNDVFLGLNIST